MLGSTTATTGKMLMSLVPFPPWGGGNISKSATLTTRNNSVSTLIEWSWNIHTDFSSYMTREWTEKYTLPHCIITNHVYHD